MARHDILPDNSMKARIQEQNERPVSERKHGQMVAKRLDLSVEKTTGQKFKELFFSDDVNNVGSYLVRDLLVPGIWDMILDLLLMVRSGSNRPGYSSGRLGLRRNERTNYNSISQIGKVRSQNENRFRDVKSTKSEFNLDNLLFRTRAEAEEVVRLMNEYIAEFGQVTVGYLYEIMGETSSQWTVETYGWTDLRDARISNVRNGYLVTLPRPVRFEK